LPNAPVIGVHDSLKGQIPRGFVVLKAGIDTNPDALRAVLVQLIRDQIGPVASLRRVDIIAGLPKTRSGEILRKTMRGRAWRTTAMGGVRQTVELPSAATGRCPLTCDDERDSAQKPRNQDSPPP
jgi:acyl-CoA synthetase (AMP-forming)/AMP-acid ligase II